MAGTGRRLRLRLFLEGVEVPVIAASIQCAPNAPAAASIQIPPLAEGTRFFPRTLVHLYFLDFYEGASPLLSQRGASKPTPKDSPAAKEPGGDKYSQWAKAQVGENNPVNNQYKLLFGGEVVGFQWTKNQSNRSLVLQCQDWSNYWDYAYQWNNTDLFGPGVKAIFSGGATNLFTDFLSDEGSDILKIIQTPSAQYPKLKGLLGGIVHLLEAIGGCYFYGKQFSGQNIFFSLAELRLHVTQMITAYEADPTTSRLLNASGFDGLFGRTLGGLGQQVSIRQAINALMGMIFHETYAIPTPLYVPASGGNTAGSGRTNLRDDPKNSFIAVNAASLLTMIEAVQTSITLKADEGSWALGEKNGVPKAIANVKKQLQQASALCKDTLNRIRDPAVQQARSFYGSASTSFDKARAAANQWKPGASQKTLTSIDDPLNAAAAQLKRAAEMQVATPSRKTIPARLNQQIFRPDVWFSAPPRCNVLFPDNYSTLQYSRSFLTEPTRLLLKTNDEFFGEDELFDNFYVTPRAQTLKGGKKLGLSELFSGDILDHELFTGINPVFEKMGELNIFAARSGTVGGKMPKIGLAQRSANFLYFKYRFAARQMTVSGRFNPYIVPGFPGLIIDKYVDQESLARRQALIDQYGQTTTDINKLLGTHFLANFTEVSHTVDQAQGRTDINCSYARQPEEPVEFLGIIRADQTVRKRFPSDALRSTDVAGLNAPRPYSLGPNYGNITTVTDVTDVYQAKDAATGHKLPFFQGTRRTGTGEPRMNVPVGLTLPASAYGADVVAYVGDPNVSVMFHAYRIQEEVPRYRREIVDLPAEEYIRPGWYGDCWHPALIGKVYESFFQTGAITDLQQVADVDGASIGTTHADAIDALAQAAKGADFGGNPRLTAPAVLALDQNSSIQAAVGFLVQVYSYVKTGGLDVEEFIRAYTWRPIASMVDMFGTSDLMLSPDGHTVLQGTEGFHSRAFGDFDDLFGLVTPDVDGILGIKRGSSIAQKGDTRKRKHAAVMEYVTALQFARAILG